MVNWKQPLDRTAGAARSIGRDGVVELRGEVKRPEGKEGLEKQARAIPEVREVRNMLHLPKVPAPRRADSPGRQKRR